MPSEQRPNILLFLPDQHRFDFVGTTLELPVKTPYFDRLCKQGMQFTQALCPSPLCAPSRASLAAGKDYHHCIVPTEPQLVDKMRSFLQSELQNSVHNNA